MFEEWAAQRAGLARTPPVHSREPYETWNGCRIDSLATQIKNPLKAGSNTKGKKRRRGSRNGPKVEGFDVVAGIEPASIGALPIAVRAAFRYMTSIFTVAYLLARH
ncbi:TPA: hypothetical protein ACMELQ_002704 [Klebsiella pneumoniae]|nr:hypothetical protein [Klebsiella pneumoniae]HBR7772357.1 hypothetical protein [Klebsiella pneumoniae]